MIYLSSFLFSDEKVIDPNIYPYNVFADKVAFFEKHRGLFMDS